MRTDTLLHITATFVIALVIGTLFGPWWGLGIAAFIGIAKEVVWDGWLKRGTPEWRDVVSNGIGLFLAWLLLGRSMFMFNVLRSVFQVLAVIASVISIVERPGDGAEKKQEVMGIVREKLPDLVNLPQWVREMFLESAFLGWIIDLIVWAANKYGFFVSSNDGGASSTTA